MKVFILPFVCALSFTSSFVVRFSRVGKYEQLPVVVHSFEALRTIPKIANLTVHISSLADDEIYIVAHVVCDNGLETWSSGVGSLNQACNNCASHVISSLQQ